MAWKCSCGNYNDDRAENCLRCGAAKPVSDFSFDLESQLKSTAGDLFDLFGHSSADSDDCSAPEFLQQSEEADEVEQMFRNAMDIIDENPEEAFKMLTEAAATGHAHAEDELGECYFYGKGTEADYSKAAYWYEKAALQNVSTAQYNLGYCYRYGEGVEKNFDIAAEWFRKAVENGNISARLELGDCYYYGYGVPPDYPKANEHYQYVSENDYPPLQTKLADCYYYGRGTATDFDQPNKTNQKSTETGNAYSQYTQG